MPVLDQALCSPEPAYGATRRRAAVTTTPLPTPPPGIVFPIVLRVRYAMPGTDARVACYAVCGTA
eukprot:3940735-Rhodomonas_salina.2